MSAVNMDSVEAAMKAAALDCFKGYAQNNYGNSSNISFGLYNIRWNDVSDSNYLRLSGFKGIIFAMFHDFSLFC